MITEDLIPFVENGEEIAGNYYVKYRHHHGVGNAKEMFHVADVHKIFSNFSVSDEECLEEYKRILRQEIQSLKMRVESLELELSLNVTNSQEYTQTVFLEH